MTEEVAWLRTDSKGRMMGPVARTPLAEVRPACASSRVIVLVPGEDVLLTHADVPTRSRRQLAQALPYALEEKLADDVERLHFALGPLNGTASPAVAVVSRDRMEQWQSRLRDAGIRPAMMVPETLAVPTWENQWSLLIDHDLALVRTGPWDGFAVDAANAGMLLDAALHEAGSTQPEGLRLLNGARNESPAFADRLSSLGLEIAETTPEQDALTALAGGFNEHETINLLQGEFSHRRSLSSQWRPWFPVIILALSWFAIEVGVKLFENHRLNGDIERLNARIENVYRQTFPDARRIVNPRVQMQQQLDALGEGGIGETGFLKQLSASGNLLHETGGITLNAMRYNNGSLHLDVEVAELGMLDRLKKGISSGNDYNAEILSATASDNRVQARLQIKERDQ